MYVGTEVFTFTSLISRRTHGKQWCTVHTAKNKEQEHITSLHPRLLVEKGGNRLAVDPPVYAQLYLYCNKKMISSFPSSMFSTFLLLIPTFFFLSLSLVICATYIATVRPLTFIQRVVSHCQSFAQFFLPT